MRSYRSARSIAIAAFVADGREQLEVTLVVGVGLRALDRDRADGLALQAKGRDDQRALAQRAPRIALWKAETRTVLVRIAEEDGLVALDADGRERAGAGALLRLHLMPVLVQVAERQHALLEVRARDVERVDVERFAHLREHLAKDCDRIERHPDGVTDLDQSGEESRAALGHEARADLEVSHDEERDARHEEPRLDDDHLKRDDRGEAPQELRAHRAPDPVPRRAVEGDDHAARAAAARSG